MLTLEKDYSIKLSSNIIDYIYPDYVFVPILEGYKLKVKNNELVKKEQMLLSDSDEINIFSPVSGKVVGAKDCLLANGNFQKCIVIENDFKEKLASKNIGRKNMNQVTKEVFLETLSSKSLLDLGTNNLLLNKFNSKKFDRIVLVGVEDEPYLASNLFLLQKYADELLETASFLGKVFKVKDNVILLKNNDRENIEKYSNILGTYPEINLNLIPDVYPVFKEQILADFLNFDLDNTLFVTPKNVIDIYNAIKKNKLVTEKFITITGNAIENPVVVNAKLGSSVKKIIDEHIRFLNNEKVVYAINGLMTGKVLDIEELIVTNGLEGIIINYQSDFQEEQCINCGKCSEVCPVSINPQKCFLKKVNSHDKYSCINCGLCSYICPAFINFKKIIKEFKDE